MRTALIALALMQAAACASSGHDRSSIVVAPTPTEIDDADTAAYEQYVDEDGRVVTRQATRDDTKTAAKPQTTRSRLFDHWTAAYLFTR